MLDAMGVEVIFLAFALDVAFGDPSWLPHPIVYMGRAIGFSEKQWRKQIRNERLAGTCFALTLILSTFLVSWGLIELCRWIHPLVGTGCEVLLLFFCLSARSLEEAAMAVAKAMKTDGLPAARKQLAMIVGRQTGTLDETAITRASIETVAENFVDGVLSPLFFACIGGVPCAMAYKMINTMDSMVGYKNETYQYFGTAAARIDDAANFIPARLSVLIIFLSMICLRPARALSSLKTAISQGGRHKSPNAGYPEAAFAGAFHIRLGGPNIYHGILFEKPWIGYQFKDPGFRHIALSCDLMLLSSFLSALSACVMLTLV